MPQSAFVDEYAEGFQLLHMLRNGYVPMDRDQLVVQVTAMVTQARKHGLASGLDPSSVEDAGYAFCAAVDEAVLASGCAFKEKWESAPLQLTLFGDQLAGEHFFDRLTHLRERGKAQIAIVEVFHMCLLLGFRGRYLLESPDKLRYLMARLADEITHARGASAALAPHGARPDNPVFPLRRVVSPLAVAAMLFVVALSGWGMLYAALHRQVSSAVAGQEDLVQMPARVAHVTITLP